MRVHGVIVSLADDLAQAAPVTPDARRVRPSYVEGLTQDFAPDGTSTVTIPAQTEPLTADVWRDKVVELGGVVPDGWTVQLLQMSHDPAAWHRDVQGEDAVTRPVWRYKFSVIPAALNSAVDIEALVKAAKRTIRKGDTGRAKVTAQNTSAFVLALGDTQVGKQDGDGTTGTIERVLTSTERAVARLRQLRRNKVNLGPVHIIWLGDCIEGVNSQNGSNVPRNDRTLTEQIRIVRRLMLEQVRAFAPLTDELALWSIAGNHDEPHRIAGKQAGRADDSYAIDCASAVGDALNLAGGYDHCRIEVPGRDRLTKTIDVAGTIVTAAHGHKFPRGNAMQWWSGQALGMQPAGDSTLLLSGHLHHLRVEQSGARTHVQVPSMDGGSAWYREAAGLEAPSGAVTLTVGGGTWDNLWIA